MARRPEWLFDDSPIRDPLGLGARAVSFLEKLPLPEGRMSGRRNWLQRWQRRLVQRVYGDTLPDGTRRIRTVLLLLPRGNGKTVLTAGLGMLHLVGPEKEGAGQAILAAGDRGQAGAAFGAAARMVSLDRQLQRVTRQAVSIKEITHPKSGSILKAVSHESYSKHGLSISFLCADELHVWPTRDLWSVLRTSMGKRVNPLTIGISTAGIGQHGISWELYDYAQKVLSGAVDDETFLPLLFEVEPDDDWQDEAVWRYVNPGLGTFRSLVEMRIASRQARELPAERRAFEQLYLNRWQDGAAAPWLDMAVWDEGDQPVDLAELEGEPCWIGVDLSSVSDLTSIVAVFKRAGRLQAAAWFFCPEEGLRKRQERDRVPYVTWAEQGFINPTPGAVVDLEHVFAHLVGLAERFRIQELAFDRWGASWIMARLIELGLPAVTFGQGFVSMGPAVSEIERLVLGRQLQHGGHPILRWNMANVAIDQDAAGNRKFSKRRSVDRIDGAVALAMAAARAAQGENTASVYDDETLRPGGFIAL